MTNTPAQAPTSAEERRSFDRLVNFTDAVVAIAVTLQLLPLIDIAGPTSDETVWHVIAANWGQVFVFLLSFIIVITMWVVHNRVFNVMRTYDRTILWLNIGWMVAIAFLPWPTAMYGENSSPESLGGGGVGLLYWLNLAAISIFGNLMARHARRHPELLEPGALERGWLSQRGAVQYRGAIFGVYFAFIGVMTELFPYWARWLALGLFPLSYLISRTSDRQPSATPPTESHPSS